jgi:predicted DNA-binding transcriptional regulator AlpA
MDHENLISRIEIAAELGVQSQTIAHWERAGWFPRPKMKLSLKRIYYDRAEVKAALDARAMRTPRIAWGA